jgi:hypothetical protein
MVILMRMILCVVSGESNKKISHLHLQRNPKLDLDHSAQCKHPSRVRDPDLNSLISKENLVSNSSLQKN